MATSQDQISHVWYLSIWKSCWWKISFTTCYIYIYHTLLGTYPYPYFSRHFWVDDFPSYINWCIPPRPEVHSVDPQVHGTFFVWGEGSGGMQFGGDDEVSIRIAKSSNMLRLILKIVTDCHSSKVFLFSLSVPMVLWVLETRISRV